jgi:hypothetical protein
MSQPRANPTRLSRLPEGEAPHGMGRLFRDARELADEDLPKLMWRIRASQRRRTQRPRLILRVAVVVGLIFAMGGFVGAYWGRRQSVIVALPAPVPQNKARPSAPRPVPAAQSEPTSALVEVVSEAPKPTPAPARPRARTRLAMVTPPAAPAPAVAPAAPAPSPAPSPISAEAALIGRAMKALRDLQEPQTALALLGEHARQFPGGVFRSEANLLRVESLLALGRKDEALSVLEHASLASAPNRDEQLVLRGELRAGNGRWLEAREDFDQVLRRHGDGLALVKAQGLQERALWGRAAARSRLGDEAGARSDLDHYLRLFPHGRFAELATKLLHSAP